jgi:pyridoxal phosphate-dependent aminotransferase EpsN
VFASLEVVGGSVCAGIFADGLCLPTGSALSEEDQDRVTRIVRSQARA